MMEQIVSFEKGSWDPREWIYAASVKVPDRYRFVQESNCIANFPLKENPTSMSDYPYISMVGRQPLEGAFSVVTDCSFDSFGAPLVVLTGEPHTLPDGRLEYGEHFEVVAYEKGLNFWWLGYEEGRHVVHSLLKASFPLEEKMVHRLKVTVSGSTLSAEIVGQSELYRVDCPALGAYSRLYAGITACEGINRFYNFAIRR